jgi:adenine phosphoribosyltransferase
LEYGKATLEIHIDALNKSDNVLIVDDLIATGGTAIASVELVKRLEANVQGCSFIIDLPELGGKKKLENIGIKVQTLCAFEGH